MIEQFQVAVVTSAIDGIMERPPGRAASTGVARLATLWILMFVRHSLGQHFEFERKSVPDSGSIESLYIFFVYAESDAPDKSAGQPMVKYTQFKAYGPDGREIQMYEGLDVALVEWTELEQLVEDEVFCDETRLKGDALSLSVNLAHKRGATASSGIYTISKTGTYYLVLANCGDQSGLEVSGSVDVVNAYGYLPANQYHKHSFFMVLLVLYISLTLTWLRLMFIFRQHIAGIQHLISAAVLCGFGECLSWHSVLSHWNSHGVFSYFFFAVAIDFAMAKRVALFCLVLFLSAGWGVTRPSLDKDIVLRASIVSILYVLLSVLEEVVSFFHHSLQLRASFLLLSSLPSTICCGAAYWWTSEQLKVTLEQVSSRRQGDSVRRYAQLQKILLGAFGTGAIITMVQVKDFYSGYYNTWHYQWFWHVGVSQLSCYAVLAAIARLWAPTKNFDMYAYAFHEGMSDTEDGSSSPGSDCRADRQGLGKRNSVTPEVIGDGSLG